MHEVDAHRVRQPVAALEFPLAIGEDLLEKIDRVGDTPGLAVHRAQSGTGRERVLVGRASDATIWSRRARPVSAYAALRWLLYVMVPG